MGPATDAHPVLALQPLWNHPPGIYRMIPEPAAVVADLPIPWDRDPFWHDPVFMYFSTFHWHPLVNGSSGFAPEATIHGLRAHLFLE